MRITAKVIDNETRDPLPGATVALYAGNVRLNQVAADANGAFLIDTDGTPDRITVTNASYLGRSWKLPDYAGLYVFELSRNYATGPGVTVTAGRIPKWVFPVGLLALLLLIKKK